MRPNSSGTGPTKYKYSSLDRTTSRHNDPLSLLYPRVLAVQQHDLCHVDRSLVMGDHHGKEVVVGIAGDRRGRAAVRPRGADLRAVGLRNGLIGGSVCHGHRPLTGAYIVRAPLAACP
jgi:hypothetical protein